MKTLKDTYAVILAGGIGTRFWPVSRESRPKQFVDILGTGSTLIQDAYNRFLNLVPQENIFIITNQSGISRKLYKEEDYHILTKWMVNEFKNNNIFHYIISKNLVKNNGGRAEI